MHAKRIALWLVVCAATLIGSGCTRGEPRGYGAAGPPTLSPQAATQPLAPAGADAATPTVSGPGVVRFAVEGEPLIEEIVVGKPASFGELTVFPILAKTQVDVGPVISLDAALAKGVAEVREIGSVESSPTSNRSNQHDPLQADSAAPQQAVQLASQGGGAQVGTLIIENKGSIPVFVLAGTVVKGGNQDRQIGQDFIINPLAQVPVDAFCVEHGRWSGERQGATTNGKFTTLKQLANAEVRTAAQYESDQGKVWQKVSEVNQANKKTSASDSLLASLDDGAIARERDALASSIVAHLDGVAPAGALVGFGYAIGSDVKGVRWFANHQVFQSFREVMANTSAIDAITTRSAGNTKAGPKPTAKALASFVRNVQTEASKREVRETNAANANEYLEAADGYGSSVILSPSAKPDASAAPKVKMSSDFVAK